MELTIQLKNLVHFSVSLLGQVIERELGKTNFQRIESLRQSMVNLRSSSNNEAILQLQKNYLELEALSAEERFGEAPAGINRGKCLEAGQRRARVKSLRKNRIEQ